MPGVTLAATREVKAAPDDVFSIFGSGASGSWLFDARCDAVRAGAPISMRLPSESLGDEPVHVLGRISRVVPERLIEIAHDKPWPGRLRILIRPNYPSGSLVTITGELDRAGLDWVMRRRGWVVAQPRDDSVHRIGLVTSKSGPGAVFSVASEYMAELAIEEINAEGGLAGNPVEVVVGDDATNPEQASLEARRLAAAGCRTVIAGVTSASFAGVASALAKTGCPVIHCLLNEGGGGSELTLRWGERPLDQVRSASRSVMTSCGGRRWYLIGNNYRWGHGAHAAGYRALDEACGQVVGNEFVELGHDDFGRVLEEIERSGADCVLSTLVGADEVAFERQVWEAGLRTRWATLSLAMEESTRERIGDDAATGIWTALGYFEGLDTTENKALLTRYRSKYGRWAPPLSSLSESVYEAIVLYAAAVRNGKGDGSGVAKALRETSMTMPRGPIESAGPHAMRQNVYVAQAVPGGFRIKTG